MTDDRCHIWGTHANLSTEDYGNIIHVESKRAGGRYSAHRSILHDLDSSVKARITTWILDQHRLGVQDPFITREIVKQLKIQRPLRVHERASRLLTYIRDQTPNIGSHFCFAKERLEIKSESWIEDQSFSQMKAWSESVEGADVMYLIEYLAGSNFVQRKLSIPGQSTQGSHSGKADYFEYQITPEGYAHLADLEARLVSSKQAFVAMWFDPSLNEAYERGIEIGIHEAGYAPIRIDHKNHNNKIDDEIIAEIRRSRLLVADFTHGKDGVRGGVYYEAGFAHGLNIPVVFTCRADVVNKLHFDTRQYNHIIWTDDKLDEFRASLANRISATIGDGPLKNFP